jgi:hypothetical protein
MSPMLALRTAVIVAASAFYLSAQEPAAPAKAEGIPPRTAPADYQAQGPAGKLTIAAEFIGHNIPAGDHTLSSEDFVAVEAAVYGSPDARTKLSFEDFSLRINDRKAAVPSQPYGLVVKNLKDPELEPTKSEQQKSKTGISTGGQPDTSSTPQPVHIPVEVRRGWEEQLRKSSMPLGDRALPQAGLLFFPYRGKTEKIQSLELLYSGPAGTATLALQP